MVIRPELPSGSSPEVTHDFSPCDKVSLDPTTERYLGEGWYPESLFQAEKMS